MLVAFLYFTYGEAGKLIAYIFYLSLFSLIFVIDLDIKEIPDILLYPAIPISFLLSTFLTGIGWSSSLIGGVIAFAFLLIPYLVYRGGMGGGDVILAGLIGLAMGFPVVLVALFLAVISGGVLSVFFLLFKIKGRKSAIAFGPFLSLAAFVSLVWGQEIIKLYFNILG